MKNLFFTLAILPFYFAPIPVSAQTLANLAWKDTTGHPNVIYPYQAAAKDAAGNIFIAGNTYVDGQGTSLLLAKYNFRSGLLEWEDTYDDSINDAVVATSLYCEGNDVYVAGTIYDSAGNSSKLLIRKYNGSSGAVKWGENWTGAYGGYDVAACVKADAVGNVFVAGTQQTAASEYEMIVLKYDSTGTHDWTAFYDSSGLYSGAVAMVEVNSGMSPHVTVTGYTGSAFDNWDFVSANYLISNGNRSTPTYTSNGSGNFSTPVGIDKDTANNTYIAGTATISGINTDIKVIKYDTNFNQKWVAVWGNADSLTTAATRMAMDANYNILVTGYTTISGGGTEMLVLKYDTGGNLKWSQTVNPPYANDTAMGLDITTDSSLNVYAVGKTYNGENYDFVTVAYDSNGNLLWEKLYNNGENDQAYTVTVDSGNVYVSGTCINDTTTTYLTLEYQQWTAHQCDTICHDISYAFENGQITTSGTDTFVEFDIYASQNIDTLNFASGTIIFTYDTTIFGNNVVGNSDITITPGTIVQDSVTSLKDTLFASDAVPTNGKEVWLTLNAKGPNYQISDTLEQLCHVKMKRKKGGNFKVFFDQFFMQGHSIYLAGGDLLLQTAKYRFVNTGRHLTILTGSTNGDCDPDQIGITYTLVGPPAGTFPHALHVDINALATAVAPIDEATIAITWSNTAVTSDENIDLSNTPGGPWIPGGPYPSSNDGYSANFQFSTTGSTGKLVGDVESVDDVTDTHSFTATTPGETFFGLNFTWSECSNNPNLQIVSGGETYVVEAPTVEVYCPIVLTGNVVPCYAGIQEVKSDITDFMVYPNPFNNSFIISFNANQYLNGSILVQNIIGQTISKMETGYITAGEFQKEIQFNQYAAGMYTLRLRLNDKEYIKKIVKQ